MVGKQRMDSVESVSGSRVPFAGAAKGLLLLRNICFLFKRKHRLFRSLKLEGTRRGTLAGTGISNRHRPNHWHLR
jgi:hypothetical protein